MLDLIFALKFIHVVAAATMFGGWLCLALVMLLGHRSGNPSVIAVTTQFVVDIEKTLMVGAVAAQPISGFPLGWAIGLSVLNEFWIAVSLAIYAVTVACWIAAFRIETRLRSLSRQAALNVAPLPEGYRRLFGVCSYGAAGADYQFCADGLAAAPRLSAPLLITRLKSSGRRRLHIGRLMRRAVRREAATERYCRSCRAVR